MNPASKSLKASALLLIIALLSVTSCKTTRLSASGDEEKAFVSKFLGYMLDNVKTDYDGMMACISPKYIKANKISVKDYKVNNYGVNNFSIQSYKKGIVVVKIWGVEKKWIHQLQFKVVKEKGKLYLYPSKHSEKYIDPWQSVQSYIKE